MDFDSLLTAETHETGAEVQIRNPNTGDLTDVFIKVMGPDSRAYRGARKKALSMLVKPEAEIDEDAFDLDVLVSVTIGWRGLMKDGKELEFSKKACRELYSKAPAIMDQVDRFVGQYKNFTKG